MRQCLRQRMARAELWLLLDERQIIRRDGLRYLLAAMAVDDADTRRLELARDRS